MKTWDAIESHWEEMKPKILAHWTELTPEDWAAIQGDQDQLVGALQKRYGFNVERARREVEEFTKTLH